MFSTSSSLSPNFLYPDFVGDMHKKTNKEKITLIPLIHIYEGNEMI